VAVTEEAVVVDGVVDEAVDVDGRWIAAVGTFLPLQTLLLPFCTIGLESSILCLLIQGDA